jgi:hypothetical protein
MINYIKTDSIIKSEVNSGIGNNKHLCVEFKDRQGKQRIFTVLNTSWGKKVIKGLSIIIKIILKKSML